MTRSRGEICGDQKLSGADRRAYVRIALRHLASSFSGGARSRAYFVDRGSDAVAMGHRGASPLRVYTVAMLDETIGAYCPKSAVILDVGCGSGDLAGLFERHGIKGRYIGIDVARHGGWRDRDASEGNGLARQIVLERCERLDIPGLAADFSLSSSALEHIADDQGAVARLSAHMRKGSYGIHIVPGPWSFFLYGFHGWRRYAARDLEELFRTNGLELVDTVRLGGGASFLLHCLWISLLETGMLTAVTFDLLPDNRAFRAAGGVLSKFRFTGLRSNQHWLKIYVWLLRLSLAADRVFRLPGHGYAVIVHKPAAGID